jgi:hypothetical protein
MGLSLDVAWRGHTPRGDTCLRSLSINSWSWVLAPLISITPFKQLHRRKRAHIGRRLLLSLLEPHNGGCNTFPC